ncbi:23 kDa integral membrane protein-like isoform X2 [Antedon mediterranea]
MTCRSSFVRSALIVINLFVWLGGTAILGVGAWIVSDLSDTEQEAPGQAFILGIGIAAVVLGVFVSLIGISGCCGACKENVCCLKLFVALVSLLVLSELVIAVFSILMSSQIEEKVDEQMMQSVKVYNLHPEATKGLDRAQYGLQCCGSSGPSDYNENINITENMVPATCCKQPMDECTFMQDSETVYQTGCTERLVEYADEYLACIIGVSLVLLVCQILSLIFGCCLIRSVQDEEKV